jgi:predicted RNase H-like nuclease
VNSTEIAVGVDGCKQGWVAVVTKEGRFHGAAFYASFADLADEWAGLSTICADIPIGLPSTSTRRADVLAQKMLGSRRSSVFLTPPRDVLMAETYEEARSVSVGRHGRGVSAQAFALRKKIFEVDEVVRGGVAVREVHPELVFRLMAGGPLDEPKRTWNGQMRRRGLLAAEGIVLPDTLDGAGSVAVDDVLDAAAVAWSARRVALGVAESVPSPPEWIDGMEAAIWW